MKPMQLSVLRRLDADAEVRPAGRFKAPRRAASEYLRRSRARRIAEGYRRAYGTGTALGQGWAGWEKEGSWPER